MWPSPEPSLDLTDHVIDSSDRLEKAAAKGTVRQEVGSVCVCVWFVDIHVVEQTSLSCLSLFYLSLFIFRYAKMLLLFLCVFLKYTGSFSHCICSADGMSVCCSVFTLSKLEPQIWTWFQDCWKFIFWNVSRCNVARFRLSNTALCVGGWPEMPKVSVCDDQVIRLNLTNCSFMGWATFCQSSIPAVILHCFCSIGHYMHCPILVLVVNVRVTDFTRMITVHIFKLLRQHWHKTK